MDRLHLSKGMKKYLTVGIISLLVYFAMKYISPVASPFLLAFLLAGALNSLAGRLNRRLKIKRSLLVWLILFIICGLIGALAWTVISSLIAGGSRFAARMPYYQNELFCILDDCCSFMEKKFGVNGIQIENFVLEQVNIIIQNLEMNVLPAFMGRSAGYIKSAAGVVSFVVVMIIAVLLIVKDYDRYVLLLKKEKELKGVVEVAGKVLLYIKTFIKTQLILLCIISAVCAAALSLSGIKGGLLYGVITGFMDMLPFIGTGIMLVPLALFMLINGDLWKAVICLALYGACALIRELLEPKLIGEGVGLWPVGILFAVFAGIRLFGLWGIIKGPLSLVIICETCRYLWKEQKE